MNHTLTRGALAAALGLSLALAWTLGDSRAQVSVGTAFTYQGRLASGGAPVNGACDFQFGLWDAASAGSQVGITQTLSAVGVSAGYFTIADLDFGASAFTGEARWLAIEVRCPAGSGSYTALIPRQALTATPYAHSLRPGAVVSGTLANDSILFVRNTAGTGSSSGVYGRSDSTSGQGVFGFASATSGTAYGVYGRSDSTAGYGVYGLASATSGTTYGVYGRSNSTDGTGMYGRAIATSGTTYGVFGRSDSTTGRGVYGLAGATSGVNYGVFGQSDSTWGIGVYGHVITTTGVNYGVFGRSDSTAGTGVYGRANASSGTTYGVYGRSDSITGYGMYGWATATSGLNYGVYAQSDSTAGTGVYGRANATSGMNYGVFGQTVSTDGRGVYGRASATSGTTYGVYGRTDSTSGRGVYGWASATSGTTYGVYGEVNNSDGYAGYFNGRVQVTGNLSKGGGSFKIDHPLDPANKYLYHSFVESPDMKNIYDGVVTLDAAGAATVTLPDWFEALNTDFRYQLTPVGAAMPGLFIAEEISANRFRIAGGVPGGKVSWQVTGIRQDAYARMNRIPVEEDKPAGERGAYLHPQAFGQPPEKGLDYQRNAAMQRALLAGGDQ